MAVNRSAGSPSVSAEKRRRPIVTLYTASGCSLCVPAKDVVLAVAASVGADVEIVAIDGDPELERLHRENLPVVTIDGHPAYRFFVDEDDLDLRLRRAQSRLDRAGPARGDAENRS